MASDTERPSGATGRQRLAATDLGTLLAALRRLYLQVSWRLAHHRLARVPRHNGSGVAPGIADPLMDHIDRSPGTPDGAVGDDRVPGPASSQGASPRSAAALAPPVEGFLSRLAAYFRRKPAHGPDPHLAEQMRHSTHDHINRAVILARQGQKEAARMHAQLAENAMRTASAYMDEAEYEAFRQQVEQRLHSIEGS